MTNPPSISVIMPAYNTDEKYLRQAIKSVLTQAFKDFELIIVNDGSTKDEVENTILSINDERIKYIKQDNGGQGNARNHGIRIAQGKYITFVDADDWIDIQALNKSYKMAEQNNLELLFFDNLIYDNINGDLLHKNDNLPKGSNGRVCADYKDPLIYDNLFNICNPCWGKLYKREFLIKNNLFFEDKLTFEDTEYYFRYIFKAKNIGFIKDLLYFYRHKSSGSIMTCGDERQFEIVKIYELIENTLKENGVFDDLRVKLYDYEVNLAKTLDMLMNQELVPEFRRRVIEHLKKSPISKDDLKHFEKYNVFIHYLLEIKS